jgi:hypothetical protein
MKLYLMVYYFLLISLPEEFARVIGFLSVKKLPLLPDKLSKFTGPTLIVEANFVFIHLLLTFYKYRL